MSNLWPKRFKSFDPFQINNDNTDIAQLPLPSSSVFTKSEENCMVCPVCKCQDASVVWSWNQKAPLSTSVFPECIARVPVSLWGSGGGGCVRQTLRNRPQPLATGRRRSREARMAVPMASSAKVVTLGGFKCRIASFRVAGVALRDSPACFITCRKSFCAAGAILLRRFKKMSCIFRGRRSTLEVILRGRRSTLDVCCCVFSANRIVKAASWSDNVQITWQAWDSVWVSFCATGAVFGGDPSCVECFFCAAGAVFRTPCTLNSTLYTWHYTQHFTLWTLHSTLYTLHSTLHALHSTLYTPHSAL